MIRALFAAAVANAAVAGLVYADSIFGYLPQLNLLAEIGNFNARLGLPTSTNAVWMTHAIIGVIIYGVVFAFLQPILPGGGLGEGITFGLLTWLTMMMVFMPLAGHTIFAQDLGPMAAVAALGVHLLYGIVLGVTSTVFSERSD